MKILHIGSSGSIYNEYIRFINKNFENSDHNFLIIDGEKISIQAKMLSLLFIPAPITLGYLVCYDKNKILASFSNLEFGKAKEEIQKFLKDEIITEKKENDFKCK